MKLMRDKFIALNSPDGDKPIKIVSSLEKAVKLCLSYKKQTNYSNQLNSVGKIFKPKFVFNKEKGSYYWADDGKRLPEDGNYYFVVDGLGYYPGNDYPIIKPDGWFHYTEITRFPNITSLMSCHMNEEGRYKYPEYRSRVYREGRHTTMYVREVCRLNHGAIK